MWCRSTSVTLLRRACSLIDLCVCVCLCLCLCLWPRLQTGDPEARRCRRPYRSLGDQRGQRARAGANVRAHGHRGGWPVAHGCGVNEAVPGRWGSAASRPLCRPGLLFVPRGVQGSCCVPGVGQAGGPVGHLAPDATLRIRCHNREPPAVQALPAAAVCQYLPVGPRGHSPVAQRQEEDARGAGDDLLVRRRSVEARQPQGDGSPLPSPHAWSCGDRAADR